MITTYTTYGAAPTRKLRGAMLLANRSLGGFCQLLGLRSFVAIVGNLNLHRINWIKPVFTIASTADLYLLAVDALYAAQPGSDDEGSRYWSQHKRRHQGLTKT